MMSATEHLLHKKQTLNKRALRAVSENLVSPSDVVKPMFDVTWGPLMGTLSQILENTNDDNLITLCLNGFVFSIRISSHSEMSLARETFVNSLAKLTALGRYIEEIQFKNIECIRTLLSVALVDREF